MQSGRANTREWILEFEPGSPRVPDPLMGWTQTTDMDGQISLTFDSRESAVAYAQRHGLAFEVLPDPEKKRIVKVLRRQLRFPAQAALDALIGCVAAIERPRSSTG